MRRGLLLAAAVAALPVAAAAQSDDRGFLTRLLEENLSGAGRAVTITGFEGALSSRATMRQLTIADAEGVWITLNGVTMQWNRTALLAGRVEIEALTAEEILLPRAPVADPGAAVPAAEAAGFSLPELPVSVSIGTLRAGRVALGAALLGTAAEVRLDGSLKLAGGDGAARLSIERIDGADGRLALDGAYSNATGVLRLDLSLAEGPGGIAAALIGLPGAPALQLAIAGTGPLDDYGADLRLATAGRERVRGRVTLLGRAEEVGGGISRAFRAELGGEVAALVAPDYAAFFGPDTRLSAEGTRFADGRLEIAALRLSASAIGLSGALRLGADGLPSFFALEGGIGAADGSPVLLPLPGVPTRVDRVALSLAFDAARGEDWRLAAEVTGLAREDIAIAALSLTGDGRIARRAEGARVLARLDFAARGMAPADPALARALGRVGRGRIVADWQEGRPVLLPDLRLDGEGYGLTGALTVGRDPGGDGPFRIEGRGLLRFEDLARFSDLAGQPLGGAGLAAFQGRFEPATGATDAALDLSGRDLSFGIDEVDRLLAGESRVAAELRRDAAGTLIREASIDARGLALRGSGTVRSTGSDLTATAVFADLGVLGPGYGGAGEAEVRIRRAEGGGETIRLLAAGRDLAVGVAELDGLLRGPTRVAFEGRRQGAALTIERLALTAPTLAIEAAGEASAEASALTVRADFADIAVLGPPWRGSLRAEAELGHAGEVQRIALTGRGRALGLGVAAFDRLFSGDSEIALRAQRRGDVIDIAWAALDAASLSARVSGRLAEGASDLAAEIAFADLARLGPGFGGALRGEARLIETGALRRLSVEGTARSLRLGQPEADTLLRGVTGLSLSLEEEGGLIRLRRLRLSNPQLSAEAEGSHSGDEGRVALTARLADMALVVPGFPGPLTLAGTVTDDAAGYGIELSADGPGDIAARIGGGLSADFGTADITMRGTGELGLLNRLILPRSVQGPLAFDLAMRGPPGLAALSGTLTAAGARIVDPTYNVTVQDATLSATLAGGQARVAAAGAMAGGGRVAVEGGLALQAPFAADLTARLDRARFTDPALYDTRVTGSLAVTGPIAGGGRIAGSLTLDETELRVPNAIGGIEPIPDIRHAGEPAEVRATRGRAGLLDEAGAEAPPGRPFDLALSILAPRRIFVRGRGLDAELGGALELTGTTAAVIPVGGFSLIRGRLDLLGRRFVLTEGQAQLEGRFLPYLRLAAGTEADGVAVRIEVEGLASEPEIRFRSSPELPEEEVLARLLFGRGIETISAIQAAQLAAAVATLAGRGGEGLVGRLRRGFGLDDLDVSTDDNGTAAVRAGRYLSENVYTDVTIGADGRSAISLNIDVTPSLTVRGRATSDGQTGIGIFFERNY